MERPHHETSGPCRGRVSASRGTAAGALALALVLAACSGGGDAESTSTSTPASVASASTESSGATVRRDLRYADGGTDSHLLDVHIPAPSGDAPPALVVYIHGGGWQVGSKADLDRETPARADVMRDLLLKEGYAVASVNYRKRSDAQWPAQGEDVAAAIAYLRQQAKSLGVDGERIVTLGDSAGGHLALQTAYTTDGIRGAVGYYPVTDFAGWQGDLEAAKCEETEPQEATELLGADPATEEGAAASRSASPLNAVRAGLPPTLLFHGKYDCEVPLAQSTRLRDALEKAGDSVELVSNDSGHSDPLFFSDPDMQQRLLAFLERATG
ncbi:MAG: alpha/beta hydrolase [Micrococcales bacterium]|nr:alpha/beta hydrolase [Micrococcales bacterium]